MAAKITENVTTLHHGLPHNEHRNIISMSKKTFLMSRDVSEGDIATIVKQSHLNLRFDRDLVQNFGK